MRNWVNTVLAASAVIGFGAVAAASEYDDGQSVKYYDTFKGKKVVLIVISSARSWFRKSDLCPNALNRRVTPT